MTSRVQIPVGKGSSFSHYRMLVTASGEMVSFEPVFEETWIRSLPRPCKEEDEDR